MRRNAAAIAVAGLCALAVPVSAQIIVTSIPKEEAAGKGTSATEKKWAFHVLLAPIAKWKYGETYINAADGVVGTVTGTPNSNILLAGEVAFKVGDDWSVGLGTWYNKVGQSTYPFSGQYVFSNDEIWGLTAEMPGDLSLYEFHANAFWRDFGLQAGFVKTSASGGQTVTIKTITIPGVPVINCGAVTGSDCQATAQQPFDASTTDWDLFAVAKHSWPVKYPVALSAGLGMYHKAGLTNSPLRYQDSHTVFSGFLTGNVEVWKGLGVDASFWYVNKVGVPADWQTMATAFESLSSQYRFTMGVSYNFSK